MPAKEVSSCSYGEDDLEALEMSKEQPPRSVFYHLKTAYLITRSDIKTTIYPATIFAFSSAISGPLLTTNSTPNILALLLRLPNVFLWTWSNLWIFNLANQRLPNSVLEDSINKPWRVIPSGRITPTQARHLLLVSIPIVCLSSFYLGGRGASAALMILTWAYNDLGAGDENFFVRHLNNALGFVSFGAGASQVACGYPDHTLNQDAYWWLGVIAVVITCTIQFQDMEDQEGDRLRNRKTLPIVCGDDLTRWGNTVVILFFSLFVPAFWRMGIVGYFLPVLLGIVIAGRTLLLRTLASDKQTFRLWCIWLTALYCLPVIKHHTPPS